MTDRPTDNARQVQPGSSGAARGGAAAEVARSSVRSQARAYPEAVERLIDALAGLPGIGRRSAERLAFHIMKGPSAEAEELARAVVDVKKRVRSCRVCYAFCDGEECGICGSEKRDRGLVLVVEQPKDLLTLEQSGMFRGVYHVLMGRLSPLDGVGPGDLTVNQLMERVDNPRMNSGGVAVREVVMGLNPTLEGDGTALYLAGELRKRGIKTSRLARGLPTGGSLELANRAVLADAIEGRQSMEG
ncbi:MAG: recombination mediator RecR [Phycisphaerales bacterium]